MLEDAGAGGRRWWRTPTEKDAGRGRRRQMMMMTMRMMTPLDLHVHKGVFTPPGGGVVRHAGYSAPLGLHTLAHTVFLDDVHARTQARSFFRQCLRSHALAQLSSPVNPVTRTQVAILNGLHARTRRFATRVHAGFLDARRRSEWS